MSDVALDFDKTLLEVIDETLRMCSTSPPEKRPGTTLNEAVLSEGRNSSLDLSSSLIP